MGASQSADAEPTPAVLVDVAASAATPVDISGKRIGAKRPSAASLFGFIARISHRVFL